MRTANRRKKQRGQRNRFAQALSSPPALITGLTVLAILGVLAVANLTSGQNSGPVPREIGAVGHDVEATSQGPDIHFAVQGVDFGLVPLGKNVSYSFSFANIGNQTLRIEDVQVRVVQGC